MEQKYTIILEKEIFQYKLAQQLCNEFGYDVVYDQDHGFNYNEEDLLKIFNVANQIIFSNKLPKIDIFLTEEKLDYKVGFVYQASREKESDPIVLREKPIIVICKDNADTFLAIVDTLCHEMIHYADYLFGPLNKLKTMVVDELNGEQFAGHYNVHLNQFFSKYVDKFAESGIPIQLKHYSRNKFFIIDYNGKILKENNSIVITNDILKNIKTPIQRYAIKMHQCLRSNDTIQVEVSKNNFCYVLIA